MKGKLRLGGGGSSSTTSEAVTKVTEPHTILMDQSEQAISSWLLSHSKLCTSCKRIPVDANEESRLKPWESRDVHHATMSELESAANEGCRICKPLWERFLERLVASEHAPPSRVSPVYTPGSLEMSTPTFCQRYLEMYPSEGYKLGFIVSTNNQPVPLVMEFYHVRPIRGKLLYSTVTTMLGCCRGE